MKKIALNRRLLQAQVMGGSFLRNTELSPDPIYQPTNASAESTSRRPSKLQPTSPFDSSMALTILILLSALFFMGFFSIYIGRFTQGDSDDGRRRRHPTHPSSSSEGFYSNQKCNGLEPSTVKSLPLVRYGECAKQLISDCPICLSEFEEREIVKLIPHCKHVFHPHCIDTWLKSHVSCPLCRSTQFFKLADEELCLDVKEDDNRGEMRVLDGGQTDRDADTWTESRAVGVRRTSSCRSICTRLVLQRSMSF